MRRSNKLVKYGYKISEKLIGELKLILTIFMVNAPNVWLIGASWESSWRKI